MEILFFVLFLLVIMLVSDKKRESAEKSDPGSFNGVLWALIVLAVAFFILVLITGATFVAVTDGA